MGANRDFMGGTGTNSPPERGPAWVRAQRQEEGQQGTESHLDGSAEFGARKSVGSAFLAERVLG